jgi:hypothetical protein
VDELGQALGYWAARYQPVAGTAAPTGRLTAARALEALPRVPDQSGGVSARVSQLGHTSGWTQATAALRPPASAEDVPAALAALTDAAVERYLSHGHGDAILLVHAATAPNAAMLTLEALPRHLWLQTHTAIWHVCAAITAGEPDVACASVMGAMAEDALPADDIALLMLRRQPAGLAEAGRLPDRAGEL